MWIAHDDFLLDLHHAQNILICCTHHAEGGGLVRLQSKKPSGLFSLPSGVRGGVLEVVEYEDLDFGKLLGKSDRNRGCFAERVQVQLHLRMQSTCSLQTLTA